MLFSDTVTCVCAAATVVGAIVFFVFAAVAFVIAIVVSAAAFTVFVVTAVVVATVVAMIEEARKSRSK